MKRHINYRKTAAAGLAMLVLLAATCSRDSSRGGRTAAAVKTVTVSRAAQLMDALAGPRHNVIFVLAPGEYRLIPSVSYDSTCGNCEDPDQIVPITVALLISGENVSLQGPDAGEAVLYTGAGYGLFFKDCKGCAVRGLTITGGERDTSQEATDAAIVVKNSSVEVSGNQIVENIGDSTVVVRNIVGIMGICGRENSEVYVYGNRIIRNSWDAIALYRGAEAKIESNLIDGVDKARGGEAGGGRGVGIGVTWDAKATIERNLIKRYWKGIGIFVDGDADVRHNIVEEMLTWGIAYWDAGKGRPQAVIENNVVYDCGACGISLTREIPLEQDEKKGRLTGNIVVRTGQNPRYDDPDYYCYQCALALHAVPEGFIIDNNLYFDNRRGSEDLPDRDVPLEVFLQEKQKLLQVYFESLPPEWVRDHSNFIKTYAQGN